MLKMPHGVYITNKLTLFVYSTILRICLQAAEADPNDRELRKAGFLME